MEFDDVVGDFYRNERMVTAKRFGRLLRIRSSIAERDFILAYAYLRRIDDLVDLSLNPDQVDTLLAQEERRLELSSSTNPEKDYSTQTLVYLRQTYGPTLFEYFREYFDGFRTDTNIRRTGRPLNQRDLERRNLDNTLPAFKILSLMAYGRELSYSKNFEELVKAIVAYGVLKDLREDLNSGLILFSKEDLERHGIKLVQGEPIPDMRGLYREKRRETARRLVTQSGAVDDTNLPFIERKVIRAYMLTRAAKLALKPYSIPEGMIFKSARTIIPSYQGSEHVDYHTTESSKA